MTARVLGVDPGTAVTGYGVLEGSRGRVGRLLECGVIRTRADSPVAARLEMVYDGVVELLTTHQPGILALEGVFFAKNVRTTIALSQARGVILLAAAHAGVEVAEFSPAVVKKTVVGEGRATKAQVGYMVQQLLRLERPPSPSDAADGVALALTYLLTRGPR